MQRRQFLRATGTAMVGVLWTRSGVPAASPKQPPNFVVIMADDLGAKELACYGNTEHRTPNLDELAETGMQFKTCYATPICHPTRFEIMTGQYGHHNKIYQFPGRRGGPVAGSLEDNIARHLTFAQVLRPLGYATAHAGKWQLTGAIPTLVRECGFDEYCMWAYKHNLPPGVEHTGGWEGRPGSKTSRYWHPSIVKNAQYLPTGPDDYGPDVFTDFVVDFITRHRNEPFFVYYPMCLTHGPFYVTPETVRSEQGKFENLRSNFKANVEYMDKLVGRIVKALDASGLRENTVVLFTGDNGTGGQGKGQPTELGARVPMIANCPGLVKPSKASDELVDLSDILPTLVDFAGGTLPEGHEIDGRSFAPLLQGHNGPTREWIYSYLGDRQILRTKRWLLEDNGPGHPGRFFDCGDSRDGTGYKDVTDSTAPEVLTAKKRFREILADKPLPIVTEELAASRKNRASKKLKGDRRKNPAKEPD
ncbi:MAG: sulfatase-like hydrolase/transferase [Phycisphaerales bacterium]|nr:MAG: sulfatase-like hydrolase/transferase [Phycisphaerales bacterium]